MFLTGFKHLSPPALNCSIATPKGILLSQFSYDLLHTAPLQPQFSSIHPLTYYSNVSNRRGVWNSRGGWKKYPKLIVRGRVGGWKKLKISIAGGLAFKLLFLSFCNHENYNIKIIWVYSKSKIITKLTHKRN